MGELYKSSFYNRFYEVGGRYWIFNTLNQGLLEVPEQSFRLLQNNKFDIEKCDQDMLEDINELIENEFVVFENYNELKTIKNLFHNDKYKRDYMDSSETDAKKEESLERNVATGQVEESEDLEDEE